MYLAKRPTQVIVETVGAGARSQSASAICWGGVSAVIGSSDLAALTLMTSEGLSNQLSCSLPFGADRSNVEAVCLVLKVAPQNA